MESLFLRQCLPNRDTTLKRIRPKHYSLCSYANPGTVLIFNQYDFSKTNRLDLGKRNGTDKDVKRLSELFGKLKFNVHKYDDLTAEEIVNKLNEHLSATDWDHSGSIVLIVLTHGEENGMLWSSDKLYHCSQLWDPILKCGKLKDKFKFIILQACRGRKREKRYNSQKILSKIDAENNPDSDSTEAIKAEIEKYKAESSELTYKSLPKAATNLLIAYSTVEGCDSVRSPVSGTWYIQELCELLDEWSRHEGMDLLEHLMVLNCYMNTMSERNDVNEGQTSTYTSFLLHSIKFKNSEKQNITLRGSSFSGTKLYKGRAYIYFDKNHKTEAHEFKETMEQLLVLPILREIGHGEIALANMCNISRQNNFYYENYVIFAIFTKCEDIMNNNIPLKLIYNNFSAENCPSLAEKAKLFFFFDAKYVDDTEIKMDSINMKPRYITSHAEFFICRGHSKEFITNINREMLHSFEYPSYNIVEIATAAKIGEDQNQEYTSNFESTLGRAFCFFPNTGTRFPERMLEVNAVHAPKFQYNRDPPVNLFTGREKEINALVKEMSSKNPGKKVITLFGMSGVGKTQIVRFFCKYFMSMFNNILIFNAENEQKLDNQFADVAKELNLISKDNISGRKNIVSLVYEYFKKDEKTLFVFDNFTNAALEFLPEHVGTHEIYIIITSNVSKTPVSEQVLLEVQNFRKSEAIEFLEKMLGNKKHSNHDIERLAKFLGYTPLNLHQSASYIGKQIKKFDNYSINMFMREFNRDSSNSDKKSIANTEEEKKFEFEMFLRNLTTEPLYDVTKLVNKDDSDAFASSYKSSLHEVLKNKLSNVQEENKPAAMILKIMAYCEPDNIPLNIFGYLFKMQERNSDKNSIKSQKLNEQKLLNSLGILTNVSVINRENNIGSIHRSVQESIRIILSEDKKEIPLLKKAIAFIHYVLVNNPKDFNGFEMHAIKICTKCLENINNEENHVETIILISKFLLDNYIFNQAYDFISLCDEIFVKKLSKNSLPIISIKQELINIHNKLRNFQESLSLNQKLIYIAQSNHGEDSIEFMNAQLEKAKCLQYLKQYDASIEILKIVLFWFESQDSSDLLKILEIEKIMASVLLDKKEYKNSLQMLEKILAEETLFYTQTDIHILSTQMYIASIYEMDENTLEKAVDIYQIILTSICQLKDIDHVLISEIQLKLDNVLKRSYLNSPTKQEEYKVQLAIELNSNQESLGIDHIQTIITQTCLISCMGTYVNKRWQALELVDNLLQICKNKFGKNHERTFQAELKKAEILRLLHRKKDAIKIYVKLHEIYEEMYDSSHYNTAYILKQLTDIRADENCLEEIILNYENFLYEKRDIVRDEIYDKVLSLSRQANVNIESENYTEAALLYEQMLKLEEEYFPVNDICNLITKYCKYNVCKYMDSCICKQMIEELNKLARESLGESHDLVLLIKQELGAS